MKITAVKTYIVPPELSATSWAPGAAWVLVKLETDTGISGWGQAHTFHEREQAIASAVHKLSPILDGIDPFYIRRFKSRAQDSTVGAGNETAAAAAGIEIALWDIVGKALNLPVHRLLGGPSHDRISVYANCWSDVPRSPDELATFAAGQVDEGFKAVKVYPFLYGASVNDGIACLDAVRDAADEPGPGRQAPGLCPHRLLVEKGVGTTGGEPWSLLVGQFTFGTSESDVTLLAALGAVASRAGGPFVAAAHANVTGCDSFERSPDPAAWKALGPDDDRRWQALRHDPSARWIGLALPRVLLRLPYGARTDEIDQFEFEELPPGGDHEAYLWGNPAVACAMLIGKAFTERG